MGNRHGIDDEDEDDDEDDSRIFCIVSLVHGTHLFARRFHFDIAYLVISC